MRPGDQHNLCECEAAKTLAAAGDADAIGKCEVRKNVRQQEVLAANAFSSRRRQPDCTAI